MSRLPFALAALLAAGCASDPAPQADPPEAPRALPASPLAVSGEGRSFDAERAELDAEVAFHLDRVAAAPDDRGRKELAAAALLSRARLTGDWDDYARADELLTEAFALATAPAGPWSTLASLQFSLHRFVVLPASIDRIAQIGIPSTTRDADVAARRGALALSTGRYDEGLTLLGQSLDSEDTIGARATRAIGLSHTGDVDAAEDELVLAANGYHGTRQEPRAWYQLHLGILDLERGRWDEALAHFEDADQELSGYWLVDEHIAEVMTLQGRTDEAVTLYRDVIERTDAPEFMDALAAIELERGNDAAAQELIAASRERWEAKMQRFPEAAWGHALGHYLDFGEPARALEIAELNHGLRPDGEAHVLLAEALLANDRAADALPIIEVALASPYESAGLHATAASVYAALGREEDAAAQRALALAIDPHALD